MPFLVTGGTGFVGAHVVRVLLARGEEVRCLVRRDSPRDNLAGLPVEFVEGDLLDSSSLPAAVAGCRRVFHCAADYRLDAPDPRPLYAVNVDGTRALLRAAAEAGAERIVHTSSVGALGLHPDGRPADESTPVSLEDMVGHYKRSKFLGEAAARDLAAAGAPIVIVNPSTPVGELDARPTPTGRIVLDFLQRRLPATVDTGLNLVDVRDVAEGHWLAAERGEPGERYILGNRNLSLREMLEMLADITGLPAPRVRLPHWLPTLVAAVDTGWSRWRGRSPRISLEAVRMSRHHMYFDASRAVRELGLPQSPVEEALQRAVSWYRESGRA